MKIHAIQTGSVRIKTAQVEGRGRGLRRRLAIFADRDWTEWLPTYAWVIEHPEGVIVVDTGQGTHLLDGAKSLHPYRRWEVMFRIEPDQEIGPQLRSLGIKPSDMRRVVLTHLHIDHDGGSRTSLKARFWFHPENCGVRVDGWDRCVDTSQIGGHHGSVRYRSTSPQNPLVHSVRAGV